METQNLTTSSRIIFSASFKDRFGEPFTSAVDFSSFAVKASSDVSTEESDFVLTKTVNGVVSLTDSGVVEFAVDATTPGEWTFSIVDVFNNEYEEHIGDSPYTYAVAEGPTDPAKCTLDSTQSIKAGEEFRVTITTYDFHGNPTNHADDTFLCTLDNDDAVEVARADDGTVEFSKSLLATGAHKLTVLHVPTNTEVAGSPISFEVLGNDNTNTYIAVGVAVFLLLVGVIIFRRHLQRAAMQLKEKELEMVGMDASQKKLEKLHMDLTAEKEELEEEVRLKKHSEEELKVMVSALESVSKERQDELKEVMMESKELKIDKLLGKGGFGVVNLATYRGTMVAMKQLLTVNEENVLRFRHECFLMKNLSHPNVVKLVGVCWSEDLFACCLEFVENGSLEDWLRRTVGGKKYVAAKIPVIGKNKNKKQGPPLAEVAFKGFDHNGEFNPAEHTDVDRAKKEEAEKVLRDWWMQRMNPKMGWTEMLKEDKSRLDNGMSSYHKYDDETRCGRAMAHCYVNATPKQAAGYYADIRNNASTSTEVLETSYTTMLGCKQLPIPILTISDREVLYRNVWFRNDQDHSFMSMSYTVEDVRVESLSCTVFKEAPGTEGEGSEVWRMTSTNFKFGTGLGFINSLAATKVGEIIVDPLMKLKLNVERLLKEYKPPEHVVEELDLTWKGGLWRMALEAALGVQYLHHHRYWSDGGKRHNGATNEVEEEFEGWKESVIHRDLKPDNMLLTRDWTLKLTDFGEARAQNMGGTMTSVGTPIYIAPEVMRADHYDVKADTWSYGLCLVAMIRAERTLEQFFYQALRKHKKKRNTKGLGMGQMTKYYYSEGWRPILPLNFVKAYPKLHTLIQECWKVRRKERPNFDQIVARLQGDIGDEIKRKEEPMITTYSLEDDLIYRNRIGKADEIEDSDDEGLQTTGRGAVSRKEYERVKEDFVKVMEELKSERSKKEVLEKDNVKMKKELAAASPTKKEEKEKIKEDKQKMDAQLGALMGGWGT
ncbi:hypothetical protein TeGR_g1117 [Tetraparma gracilis]|uniref:Protein kinase domain-containing protein n=1 Tax=Tetraparma gracilis TaxID=2962635 RepID=A0ABQ6NCE9_9STRA|nr:hypothetical protein TeGR_g1117 [Tetraparma gracilis]